MERRSANNQMSALVPIFRIAPANRRFNCLRRDSERLIRVKTFARFATSVRIANLQGKCQNPATVVQQVGRETRCEFLSAFRHYAIAPNHGARHSTSEESPSRLWRY